jgi:hypothetical protein
MNNIPKFVKLYAISMIHSLITTLQHVTTKTPDSYGNI